MFMMVSIKFPYLPGRERPICIELQILEPRTSENGMELEIKELKLPTSKTIQHIISAKENLPCPSLPQPKRIKIRQFTKLPHKKKFITQMPHKKFFIADLPHRYPPANLKLFPT
jgi:hypothetical protein